MVAVPSVECTPLWNLPDAIASGELPSAAGRASLTYRLTASRSGRNAYQITNSAATSTGITNFQFFICLLRIKKARGLVCLSAVHPLQELHRSEHGAEDGGRH